MSIPGQQIGAATLGQAGTMGYVNAHTGNLVLQRQDDILLGRGPDIGIVRTYNSQGLLDDDNADNWRIGLYRSVGQLTGTVNTAGSTIRRIDGDGAEQGYAWDAGRGMYVGTDGAGSYDTLGFSNGTWTWTDGDTQATETYDWSGSAGKLIRHADADGFGLNYTYTGKLLTTVVNAAGERTSLDYSGNLLVQIRTVTSTGATLIRTRYAYDASGRLTQTITDLSPQDGSIADGNVFVTSYAYDDRAGDSNGGSISYSNRVARISQSDGVDIAFTYALVDGSWRVASITDALGRVTSLAWDSVISENSGTSATSATSRTTVTDAAGSQTIFTSDSAGRLTSLQGPAVGGKRPLLSWDYNANGDLLRQTDARGNSVNYEYDANGNLVRQRDAAGTIVTRVFDARNRLLVERLSNAATGVPESNTRYAWDSKGHLRFVVSAEGRVTEYRYNGLGQRTSTIIYTDARYGVDPDMREVLRAILARTALSESQLAAWVAGSSVDKTRSLRTDTSYDFRGQVSSSTTFARTDAAGNGIVDGRQATTRHVYDQAGQLLSTTAAKGVATTGNPADYISSFVYDGLGRLSASTDSLGRATLTQYDSANRRVVTTMANGLTSTAVFNAAGELTSLMQSDGSQATGTTRYQYDAAGRLRITQDPTGVKSYLLYDEAGRKVASIEADGSLTEYLYNAGKLLVRSISYATALPASALAGLLDASGKPANVALASIRPAASDNDRSSWHFHDAANRLVKSVDEEGFVSQQSYDAGGNVISMLRFATAVPVNDITTATLPEDPAVSPAASPEDRRTRYFFDADGKPAATLDAAGYLSTSEYDGAGRLIHTIGYAHQTDEALRSSGTLEELRPVASDQDIHGWIFHDGRGNVTATVDGEGYLSESLHDLNGNQTRQVRYASKALIAPQSITASTSIAALRPASSARDQVTTRSFTALDQLETLTDYQGTITRYTYDQAGKLIATDKAWGTAEVRTLQSRHDRLGRLTGELSAEGSAQLAGLSALAAPTASQVDAIWSNWGLTHTYDRAGRRSSTTDANGNRTLFYYNTDGRLTHTINALGEVSEVRFNALNQATQTIRYGTRIAAATLNELAGGLIDAALTAAIDAIADTALDSVHSSTYTLRGQLASAADALGAVSSSTYNAFGELASRTLPANMAVAAGTSVAPGLVPSPDPNHRHDHYSYDQRGQLVRVREDANGLDRVSTTVHDAFGRTVLEVDASGNRRAASHDRLGRVVQTIDSLGAVRSTTYDAFSRTLTQADALGNVTTTSYDAVARSVTVTTAEGISITSRANRHGQVISITDGRGNTSSSTYDRNGNLLRSTDAASSTSTGRTRSNGYDRAGQLIASTDAGGVRTTHVYDAANRILVRRLDPEGLDIATRYAWDAKGQALSVTDANGVETRTSRDLNGQVVQVAVDPDGLNLRTAWTYDQHGNTLTVTEGAGTPAARVTAYRYDTLDRRIEETIDPAGLALSTRYAYDQHDNMVAKTDANGHVTRYFHDAGKQLVYSIDPLGGVTQNVHDANGRVTKVINYAMPLSGLADSTSSTWVAGEIAGSIVTSPDDRVTRTVFDRDGRAVYAIDSLNHVTQNIYDANGNVVQTIAYARPIDLAIDMPIDLATDPAIDPATGLPTGLPTELPAEPGVDDIAAAVLAVASATQDRSTRTVYDAANRAVYVIDAAGAVQQNVHDAQGNVVRAVAYANLVNLAGNPGMDAFAAALVPDPARDQVTRTVRDAAGRPVFVIDGLGYVKKTRYDALGRVLRTISHAQPITGAITTATGPAPAMAVADVESALGLDSVQSTAMTGLRNPIQPFQWVGSARSDVATAQTENVAMMISTYMTGTVPVVTLSWPGKPPVGTTARFEYRPAGSTGGFVNAPVSITGGFLKPTKQQVGLSGAIYSYEYRISYTDNSGQVLRSAAGSFNLSMGIFNAAFKYTKVTSTAAAGSSISGYIAAADVAAIAYLDAVVTDKSTGKAISTARTWPEYEPGYSGHVNLSVGTELPEGSYTIAIRIHKKDGTEITQPGFSYEVGLQASGDASTTVAWNAGKQPPHTSVQFEYAPLRSTSFTTATVERVGLLNQVVLAAPAPGPYQYRVRYIDNTSGAVVKQAHGQFSAGANGSATVAPLQFAPGNSTSASQVNTFHYDSAGRLVASTDAAGYTETWTRDALGNKKSFVNKNGAEWKYEHDAAGRLVTETSPAVAVTSVSDSLVATTESSALQTRLGYDALGNLTSRTEAWGRPEARTTRYEYDALGRQVKTIHPEVLVYGSDKLATNGLDGVVRRTEVRVSPTSIVRYDRFGNALVSTDAAGNYSYKLYDQLGRVTYEIDAGRYVTAYDYNAFGQQIRLTRHAWQIGMIIHSQLDDPWTLAEVQARLSTSDGDRSIQTGYDRLGRVVTVIEPQITAYDASAAAGSQYFSAGKTTISEYDAFGRVTRQSILRNPLTDTWAHTRSWYDARGNKTAQLDPMGYLSTWEHDAGGNIIRQVDHAKALAAESISATGYGVPVTTTPASNPDSAIGYDRELRFDYDLMNRKIRETRVNVEYASGADTTGTAGNSVTNTSGDISTEYGYDAVGNLVQLKDANGDITWTWYDALGRIRAVATPASNPASTAASTAVSISAGDQQWGLTVLDNDVFGNVTRQTRHANASTGVSAAGYTRPFASNDDQVSFKLYDTHGHMIRAVDAEGKSKFTSYNAMGQVAKEWHAITDADGSIQNAVRVFRYDMLGRQIATTERPVAQSGATVDLAVNQVAWNAFGEITQKGVNSYQEYFQYNNAGQLWRTNSGDGVNRVYLYDLQGTATAEIRSQQLDLRSYRQASDVAALSANVMRTDTLVDLNERVIGRVLPSFTVERSIEAAAPPAYQAAALDYAVAASGSRYADEGGETFWGTNQVNLSWPPLGGWGDGTVYIEINYTDPATAWYDEYGTRYLSSKSYGLEISALATDTGTTLAWPAQLTGGGIESINWVAVHKRDVSGSLLKVYQTGAPGPQPKQFMVATPTEPGGRMGVRLRASGSTGWFSAALTDMGRQTIIDTANLNQGGVYDYQILYYHRNAVTGQPDLSPYAHATGQLGINGAYGWMNVNTPAGNDFVTHTPVIRQSLDRWGNVIEVSSPGDPGDPGSPDNAGYSATTRYRYNDLNKVVQQTSPEVDVWGEDGIARRSAPVSWKYYDRLGRELGTRDANGKLNTVARDAAGHVIAEYHADGGIVSHAHDVLGRKTSTTDARGNITYWTWDRMDRLKSERRPIGADYYDYDEAGNRIREYGNRLAITNWYDTRGKLVRTRLPMGQETTWQYDTRGNKIRERDANGFAASWTYDYFGRVQLHFDLGGANTSYSYNKAGLLVSQTNTRGQNLAYTWYENGAAKSIVDKALNAETFYEYDAAGNRTRERFRKAGVTHQDNRIAFDSLGRITFVQDNRYALSYGYDANGNRRFNRASYYDTAGAKRKVENWYRYDSMNRIRLSQGVLANGYITINDAQGVLLSYDLAGNRSSTFSIVPGAGWSENYYYDRNNRLTLAMRSETESSIRSYDTAGRVIEQSSIAGTNASFRRTVNDYNANGWLTRQQTFNGADTRQSDTHYTGYDNTGNLLSWQTTVYPGTPYTNFYSQEAYARFDSYKERVVHGSSSLFQPGTTTSSYDVNGNLIAVSDQFAGSKYRSFVTDHAGRIFNKTENGSTQYYFHVNDKPSGSTAASGADFDFNYTPVSAHYPASTPGTWVVNQGDTLRSIAQATYGDARLWYMIAGANGLRTDADLGTGRRLTVPNKITNLHNDSSTFKPYAAGTIIGDTTPTLPDPPPAAQASSGGGCGGLGSILVAVVTIAVASITAGAVLATMSSVLGGVAGTVAAGAIGGAIGSIAGQGVAMALGMQDKLSWDAVAMGAIGGGVGGGVGIYAGPAADGATGLMTNAVATSVATQGIAIVVGVQDHFSWQAVAAAAVGAGIGATAGKTIAESLERGLKSAGAGFANVAARIAAGMVRSAAQVMVRGGRMELAAVSADAFGNVLGNEIAGEMGRGSQQAAALYGAQEQAQDFARENARLDSASAANAGDVTNMAHAQWLLENGVAGPGVGVALQGRDRLSLSSAEDIAIDMQQAAIDPRVLETRTLADQFNALRISQAIADGEDLAPTTANAARLRLYDMSGGGMPVKTALNDVGSAVMDLAGRFGEGLLGAMDGVTFEPARQLADLGKAGASVIYNELVRKDGDPYWLPDLSSNLSAAYTGGTSQTKLLLGVTPFLNVGVASYDATTSLMEGRYGDAAAFAGATVGGFAIGKGVSRFGDYGVAIDDIGATGLRTFQAGSIGFKLVVPGATADGPFSPIVEGGGLQAHEAAGGHLILKHVGKSAHQLFLRLADEPKLSEASSFYNRITAEAAVSTALAARQSLINDWLRGSATQLMLQHDLPDAVGILARRGTTNAVESSTVTLVLKRDRSMQAGYLIRTGFLE